jgi:hypothetical protein
MFAIGKAFLFYALYLGVGCRGQRFSYAGFQKNAA